jgi:hypothetical protein
LPAALTLEAASGVICVFVSTRRRSFAPWALTSLYVLFGVVPFAFLITLCEGRTSLHTALIFHWAKCRINREVETEVTAHPAPWSDDRKR